MRRLIFAFLPCLVACSERPLDTAGDGASSSGSGGEPATTTGEVPTTTGEVPTTTGEVPTTTGEVLTTGEGPTTGGSEPPAFCGEPGAPGLAWKDTQLIDANNTGDWGDGVAVDALGQIFFSKVTPEGELALNHRSSDGSAGGAMLTPGEGRDRAESLALASDGTAIYVATAGAVLAVDPSLGDLLWEHASGAVLQFHDVLADPQGGVLARGVAGLANGVVVLDGDGGPRLDFTDDAMLSNDHAGFARNADGELILAFNIFVADPPANLRVRKHAANTGEVAWQRLHDRDTGLVISAAVVAGDGAIYLAGEESESGIADNMVTLYRLGADGAFKWAVAVGENPRNFGEAAQGLVALVDGDVVIAPTELPQVLRFTAAGELVRTIDISDGMIVYTGMAMQQDPCGAVAFVHTGFHEPNPDADWQRALTVGRLWP